MSEQFIGYVVARVPDAATWEKLIQALEIGGFDRAQLGAIMPDADDPFTGHTVAVETDDDRQQLRVLGTSMGATVAGLAMGGVAAAATGGLMLPVIAAGVGAAGGVAALSEAYGLKHARDHEDWIHRQLREGGVVLHVSVNDDAQRARALEIARAHCGTAVFCDQSKL